MASLIVIRICSAEADRSAVVQHRARCRRRASDHCHHPRLRERGQREPAHGRIV